MARTEEAHGHQPGRESGVVAETHFELQSVPVTGEVTIRGSAEVIEKAADYGAYFTNTYAGTEAAAQLLPRDKYRRGAHITCPGPRPGWGGSEAQAKTTPKMGFSLASGVTPPLTPPQPVWVVPHA